MLRLLLLSFVCVVFQHEGLCQTWSPGSPRDRATIYVCSGQTLRLSWNFTLQDGQRANDVKWYHQDKLIAIFSKGTFFPLLTKVRHLTSGVLEIENLTSSDSGTYSIEVGSQNEDGGFSFFRRSAVVKIGGDLMTDDGQLHVSQDPKTVLDPASNLWSVALLCGRFLYDNPPFQVEWVTESGSVQTSTDYVNGYFRLLLSRFLGGGDYTCKVPQHHAATACVHGNKTGEASLKVDDRELRLILLEAGQAALQAENNKLKEESRHLRHQIQNLQETDHSLNITLSQQVQGLQAADHSLNITLSQQVQGLQETDRSLNITLHQQVQGLQETAHSLNITLSHYIADTNNELKNCIVSQQLWIDEFIMAGACRSDSHTVIDDYRRDVSTNVRGTLCDDNLAEGWYRFLLNGTNAVIPTSCVEEYRCGTSAPFWLDLQGKALPVPGQEIQGRGCGRWRANCCVNEITPITVKNCGNYFVYKLKPTPHCSLGYCAQIQQKC